MRWGSIAQLLFVFIISGASAVAIDSPICFSGLCACRVINFRAPNENNSALLMDKGNRDHLITRDEYSILT